MGLLSGVYFFIPRFYFFMSFTRLSIADSREGNKNVKPVALIFLLLTVALFNISMLLCPNTSFKPKAGTYTGIKNLLRIFWPNSMIRSFWVTVSEATAL